MRGHITQRECRELIADGTARNANEMSQDELRQVARSRTVVATGAGVYGINCALVVDGAGNLVAVPSRSSALFVLV